MINLFRALGIGEGASPKVVQLSLETAHRESGPNGEIDGLSVAHLQNVLGDEHQLTQYRRVHDQYAAIASAATLLDLPGTSDSHRWRERTVEFADD